MTIAFVPDGWRLVTRLWIDHSAPEIGPIPFVTTKSVGANRGWKNAANVQIAVTNAGDG
jgi:hypothetical protein